jgi:hypothetical protein
MTNEDLGDLDLERVCVGIPIRARRSDVALLTEVSVELMP